MHEVAFLLIIIFIFFFSLASKFLERRAITSAMIFVGFGCVMGTMGLDLIPFDFDHGFIHLIAEVTLVLVLFSDASRIELAPLLKDHNLPVRMLVFGLPLIVMTGTIAGMVLPLGLDLLSAALLASILAPTDAALGQAVVTNNRTPLRIRQALNAESGLNDGLALPLVLLFATLVSGANDGDVNWLRFGATQIGLGLIVGGGLGFSGAVALDRAAKRGWMNPGFEGAAILSLALLSFGVSEYLGGNGFIAAFVGGLSFGNSVRGRCEFLYEFVEAEGQMLTLVTFLIFGSALVPLVLVNFDPWIWVYAVLSITVIRMLPVTLSLLGSGVKWPTSLYLGWFGPRGLASLLFLLFVLEDFDIKQGETILQLTVSTVLISIFAHGLTAAPLTALYGRWIERYGQCAEHRNVSAFRSWLKAKEG